jgi:hypothetical protein
MIKFIKNIVGVVKSFINDDFDNDYSINEPSKKDIESFKEVFAEASKDPDFRVYAHGSDPDQKNVIIGSSRVPDKSIFNKKITDVKTDQCLTEQLQECIESADKSVGTIFDRMYGNKDLDIPEVVIEKVSEDFQQEIRNNTDYITKQMNELGYETYTFADMKKEIKAGKIDFSKLNHYNPDETANSMDELINIANDLQKNDLSEIKSIISDLSEKLTHCNKWLLDLNNKISDYENRDVLHAVSERPDNGGYGVNLPLEVLENVSDEEFFKNKDIPDVLLANAENHKPASVNDVSDAFNVIASSVSGKLYDNNLKTALDVIVSSVSQKLYERDEYDIDLKYESNMKKEQEEALRKFKEMHQQATLSPNVSKFKLSNKQKSKTTKTKSPAKKTKKSSKSKSKKV